MARDTTVRVHRSTWRRLNRLRSPGETFDDIIVDLLDGMSEEEQASRVVESQRDTQS